MRHKMTILALSLAAAVALGCGAGGGGSTASGSGDSKGDDKAAPKVAKIGDPARDGKFEFTVTKVKCGASKLGSDFMSEKAQGQFCLITIKVKNIGKEPQSLSDSNQKAYTADGTEYSTDSTAGLVAAENNDTLWNEINPGNQVTGILVFDIPKKVKLAKVELHDSAFSGGVEVKLA